MGRGGGTLKSLLIIITHPFARGPSFALTAYSSQVITGHYVHDPIFFFGA